MARRGHKRKLRGAELLEARNLLAGNLVANWQFDSTSGTVLVDSVGAAAGTVTGSSVFNQTATAQVAKMPIWTAATGMTQQWGSGVQGGALRTFSDTDGALVAQAVAPGVQSLSFWFKADNTNPGRYNSSAANGGSTSGTSVAMPLFEMGNSTSGLNVYIYNTRLYVGAWVNGGGTGNETFIFSGANAIVAGRWYQVTVTLDAAEGATGIKAYLNGPGQLGADPTPFAQGQYRAAGGAADIGIGRTDGTTRFLLGTSGTSAANNDTAASNNHRGFAGTIDEMRVYDGALTAAEIRAIHDVTRPVAAEEQWLLRDSGRSATIGRFRFAGQLASEHFVMKWGSETTDGNPLTVNGQSGAGLITAMQHNLNRLEMSWDIIVEQAGMAPPTARNGVTYKVNLYVLDSGLWFVDAGGTFSGAFAGDDPTGFAAMYTSPWALGGGTTTIAPWGTMTQTTVTPHEFTHALQAESDAFTGNNIPGGAFWETHANFGASLVVAQTPANQHSTTRDSIRGRYGRLRHRYSTATDMRYQAHPFLNWLYDFHDNDFPVANMTTSSLWNDARAAANAEDPYQVLRSLFPTYADFAATYARYVASTVTYKEIHDGALLSYTNVPDHNWTRTTTSADRFFRTYLEAVPTSPGWYQVPEAQTLEQYGANIIPLTMQGKLAGQTHQVTVNLDGYVNPGQANGVYATLVAAWGTGAGQQESISPTWENGEMTWTVPAAATHLYLTVTAVPTTHRNYIWSHPYHPVGATTQKLEHFPYRVAMSGAVPARNEVEADRAQPAGGVRHMNPDGSTGGWKTVSVPATVYIAYNAAVTGGSVSGNARIEDRATVTGGTVNGNAVLREHAVVTGGTVTGNAVVDDWSVVAGGTVQDFARLRGNAFVNIGNVRGDSLISGYGTVGTGVFDQGSAQSGALVSGTTVVKGFGYVSGAPQMTGNAMVMASGIGSVDRVSTLGVSYNGEPSDLTGTNDELGLEDVDFQNLFARYLFATQDNNVVWDNVNTTWGWMSAAPPTWVSASGQTGIAGVLEFTNENQFVELTPELSDWRDWTAQMWTRWDGSGDASQKIWEFKKDDNNYMFLQPTSAEGGVKFVIAVNGVVKTLLGATALTANQWQHVAVTFSGNTAKLYVNGSAVATRTTVTMDPYQVDASSALLGRGVGAGSGYRGRVDNLLFYSDARSAAEILVDVRAVLGAGYVPAADAPADQPENPDPPTDSDAILVLRFARHDADDTFVTNGQAVANGDLKNSATTPLAETNPPAGGMVSSGAAYATYNTAAEGLSTRPETDGYALNTISGQVHFTDAGSALETALATNNTFAALARAKRMTDTGNTEFIIGRPDAVESTGAWSVAVDANDHIVAAMGGVSFDTGITWALGSWHEVGISYDGTGAADGTVLVYVDGRRVGAFSPGAIGTDEAFSIGAGLAGANPFAAVYDLVEFWDHATADSEFAELSNVSPTVLPGDYNNDGSVNAADYTVWRNATGPAVNVTPGTGADGNADGQVNSYDWQVWRANYGRTAQIGSGAAMSLASAAIASPESATASVPLAMPVLATAPDAASRTEPVAAPKLVAAGRPISWFGVGNQNGAPTHANARDNAFATIQRHARHETVGQRHAIDLGLLAGLAGARSEHSNANRDAAWTTFSDKASRCNVEESQDDGDGLVREIEAIATLR